jgi:hypothetical protein
VFLLVDVKFPESVMRCLLDRPSGRTIGKIVNLAAAATPQP